MQFTTSTNLPHQCLLRLYTISFWDVLFIIWVLPECSPSRTTNSTPCFLWFELTFTTCLRQLHSPSSSSGYSSPHLILSSPAKTKIQSDKVLQHLKQRLRTRRRRGDEEEGTSSCRQALFKMYSYQLAQLSILLKVLQDWCSPCISYCPTRIRYVRRTAKF